MACCGSSLRRRRREKPDYITSNIHAAVLDSDATSEATIAAYTVYTRASQRANRSARRAAIERTGPRDFRVGTQGQLSFRWFRGHSAYTRHKTANRAGTDQGKERQARAEDRRRERRLPRLHVHDGGLVRARARRLVRATVCWEREQGSDDSRLPSVFEIEGRKARVIVDPVSLGLLSGSTLDYSTELIGSQFKLKDNPHASDQGGCGCGVSKPCLLFQRTFWQINAEPSCRLGA